MFRTVRELGVAVREKRTTLGLSQAEAARQAGVSREWVISLERGKPNVQLGQVFDLLAVLDLSLSLVELRRDPAATR